jgi:hypothetical protein
MQMVDVHLPTTDRRHIILARHTRPDSDQQILPRQSKLAPPPRPAPGITADAAKTD